MYPLHCSALLPAVSLPGTFRAHGMTMPVSTAHRQLAPTAETAELWQPALTCVTTQSQNPNLKTKLAPGISRVPMLPFLHPPMQRAEMMLKDQVSLLSSWDLETF